MAEDVRFRLLGSLEVTAGGRPVTLPGRRVRSLLALLVLRANQPVTTERIIAALWGQGPPKAARESVHYLVHQLRRALPRTEDDRHGMLERHGGYLLRVPPEQIDVVCFQRGVEQADAALDRSDYMTAWELYTKALGWWRGPALDGLADVPFAAAEIAGLTELRRVAAEQRTRVGLRLGMHDRAPQPPAPAPATAISPPPGDRRDHLPRQEARKLVTALVVGLNRDLAVGGDPEAVRAETTTARGHIAERIRRYGGEVAPATDSGAALGGLRF